MTEIAAIVNFCTHDLRFLDKCIEGLRPFCKQIIIPVCDHFYNGEIEDLDLLGRIYKKYTDVTFVEFAYSEDEVYGTPSKLVPNSPYWAQHWHNSARLIGSYFLKQEIDQVLFVDVDEIFSSTPKLGSHEALRFGTYWYFRKADQCAKVFPDGLLMIKKKLLSTPLILNEDERKGMFWRVKGSKEPKYLEDGKPIVHHYSWVRKDCEMLHKVKTWGHHWERDWESLMKKDGDFVRGYEYTKVKPFWDPLKEEILLPKEKGNPNARVAPKDIFRKEIRAEFLVS